MLNLNLHVEENPRHKIPSRCQWLELFWEHLKQKNETYKIQYVKGLSKLRDSSQYVTLEGITGISYVTTQGNSIYLKVRDKDNKTYNLFLGWVVSFQLTSSSTRVDMPDAVKQYPLWA